MQLERLYPPWLVYILAMVHRDKGEFDKSIAVAREAIKLEPKDLSSKLVLCSAHALKEERTNAKNVAEEIIRDQPAFQLSDYMNSLHYRDPAKTEEIAKTLRDAGLPD